MNELIFSLAIVVVMIAAFINDITKGRIINDLFYYIACIPVIGKYLPIEIVDDEKKEEDEDRIRSFSHKKKEKMYFNPPGEILIPSPLERERSQFEEMKLRDVLSYLNDNIDNPPHLFIVGQSGAGKSTFLRLLLSWRLADQNYQNEYIIITGKKSSIFTDVHCIGRDKFDPRSAQSFATVDNVFDILLKELGRRDDLEFEARDELTVLNVIIDDATIITGDKYVKNAVQFIRAAALIGREIRVRLILVMGSVLLKELDLEGRGDLRDHFAVVKYEKKANNQRATTMQPYYKSEEIYSFDSSRVPELSKKSIVPSDFEFDLTLFDEVNERLQEENEWENGVNGVYFQENESETEFTSRLQSFKRRPSGIPEKVSVSVSRFSPPNMDEIAQVVNLLRNGNPPSEIIKKMKGYNSKRYKEFKSKVDYVLESLEKNIVEESGDQIE